MKAIDQTILHDPENGKIGNCFQACVASIFELPLEDVPHFSLNPSRWWLDFKEWLLDRGVEPEEVTGNRYIPPGHYIASGMSRRRVLHSCVFHDGALSHDPHPSRTGLVKVDYVIRLLVVEPSRMKEAVDDRA